MIDEKDLQERCEVRRPVKDVKKGSKPVGINAQSIKPGKLRFSV